VPFLPACQTPFHYKKLCNSLNDFKNYSSTLTYYIVIYYSVIPIINCFSYYRQLFLEQSAFEEMGLEHIGPSRRKDFSTHKPKFLTRDRGKQNLSSLDQNIKCSTFVKLNEKCIDFKNTGSANSHMLYTSKIYVTLEMYMHKIYLCFCVLAFSSAYSQLFQGKCSRTSL